MALPSAPFEFSDFSNEVMDHILKFTSSEGLRRMQRVSKRQRTLVSKIKRTYEDLRFYHSVWLVFNPAYVQITFMHDSRKLTAAFSFGFGPMQVIRNAEQEKKIVFSYAETTEESLYTDEGTLKSNIHIQKEDMTKILKQLLSDFSDFSFARTICINFDDCSIKIPSLMEWIRPLFSCMNVICHPFIPHKYLMSILRKIQHHNDKVSALYDMVSTLDVVCGMFKYVIRRLEISDNVFIPIMGRRMHVNMPAPRIDFMIQPDFGILHMQSYTCRSLVFIQSYIFLIHIHFRYNIVFIQKKTDHCF